VFAPGEILEIGLQQGSGETGGNREPCCTTIIAIPNQVGEGRRPFVRAVAVPLALCFLESACHGWHRDLGRRFLYVQNLDAIFVEKAKADRSWIPGNDFVKIAERSARIREQILMASIEAKNLSAWTLQLDC
jgi:hypothetical protein